MRNFSEKKSYYLKWEKFSEKKVILSKIGKFSKKVILSKMGKFSGKKSHTTSNGIWKNTKNAFHYIFPFGEGDIQKKKQ